MTDLFSNPHTRARATDPGTSHKAAEQIVGHLPTIRAKVEAFAQHHVLGFTDEDIGEAFKNYAYSSVRTRRNELQKENIIIDSGLTRRSASGREMIVWLHRDNHPAPGPIVEPKPQMSKAQQIKTLEARVHELEAKIEQLTN